MNDWKNLVILALCWNGAVALADAPPVEAGSVKVARGDVLRYVILPGRIRSNQQATLYAKVAGYLKSLAVDKGDPVKAGQLLGEIEVPELQADLVAQRQHFEDLASLAPGPGITALRALDIVGWGLGDPKHRFLTPAP